MRATIVIIALLMPLSIPVRAEPLPMPKRPSGVCPYGYVSDGSFCAATIKMRGQRQSG